MAFGKLKIAIASILTLALVSGCASAVSPKSPTDATPDAIPTNRNHFEAVQKEPSANKPAVAQVSRDIKVGFLFVGLPGDYGFTYAQNQGRLLALNAAVEAARAGTHGKGFAVVSDEVRNLAAKSAEAAKDSEALITDSINRAELGTQIANETAAALSGIVLGVKESNRIISDIAKFAEEQGVSIAGINTDIEQIGKIVRQNSEAAQASASSSQEMSTQAESLQEMTARFKLK